MADGMFGAPIGISAYDNNNRQDVLAGASVANTLSQMASRPSQIRLHEAQAGELEDKTRQSAAFRNLMMQVQGGLPEGASRPSIAEIFDRQALAASASGFVEEAQKLAGNASQIRHREEQDRAGRTTQALNLIKQQRETTELLGQYFGGVDSQEELDHRNKLFEFQTGTSSPFRGKPFDAEAMGQLDQMALSSKERLDLMERGLSRDAITQHRKGRRAQFDTANDLAAERLHFQREQEERRRKAGETRTQGRLPGAEPKAKEIEQVESLLKRDYPWLADSRDNKIGAAMKDATFTVAAEARAKMRANPALSISSAISQAYTEAQRNGDFSVDGGTMGFGKKFSFAGGGRSPETALPQPADKSYKDGRFYMNSKGQIAKWNGKQFVSVQAGSNRLGLSGNNRLGNSSEEDDE